MPRVIKHPEIRRAEILDAAFAMFIQRGYDNTSLNDVIAGAGLSKGMFYHHFASKEALLEALFDRITDQAYAALEPIISALGVDPKTRLQRVLVRGAEIRLESVKFTREVFESLLRPENKDLYHRIEEAWANRMRPILSRIIAHGVDAGVFTTSDPEGVADLMLQMQISTKYLVERGVVARTTREREAAAAELDRRMKMHAVVIARSLELPDRTLTIGPPDFAKKFLRGLNPIARGSGASPQPLPPKRRTSR
jgi:AcrR family transcriptional regulator